MIKKLSFLFILTVALFASNIGTAQQWGDYTLYSVQNSTATYLIDTNSATVKTWTHASTAKTGYSCYLLPGGTLLRTVARTGNSFTGGPICGEVQKVDWNGNVIWDYVYSTTSYCTHHDICPMPNGNVLLIAYEVKTATEATAAGSTSAILMWPDKIVEVKPTGATTGTVVWEWHAWDHLVQNVDASKANYQTSIVDHPELLNINFQTQKDWLHMNGLDYNPILDQIAFSSHNLSEWYIIDHSTTMVEAASHSGGNSGKGGDILYRWGNPAAYGATGTKILNVTHDAHWIPEGVPNAGYLVGYNNQGISTTASCVDMVSPPLSGYTYTITPGAAFAPSTYLFRQPSGGYNSNMGNSQQLPNGNMLLTVATAGTMKEFSPNGTLLWSKTASGNVPQSFRYDTCYVKHAAPAIPTISQNGDTLTSSSAATYQWYLNGVLQPGETSQTIVPSQNGIYLVRGTDLQGCQYSYSLGYNFQLSTGIAKIDANTGISIYPNPSNGLINIGDSAIKDQSYSINVFDSFGKLVLSSSNKNVVDLSSYDNGIYYLSLIVNEKGPVIKKIVILK